MFVQNNTLSEETVSYLHVVGSMTQLLLLFAESKILNRGEILIIISNCVSYSRFVLVLLIISF